MLAGAEFEAMDSQEQRAVINQLTIFSRVEPSHKTRLVELLKNQVRPFSCLKLECCL